MSAASDPLIRLLEDLVAIDSVNPSLAPGGGGEAAIARRIAAECEAAGLVVEIADAAPGRPNVIAELRGAAPGPTLMFCGHMDTVGVGGMEAPFVPEQRGDLLYGRGAQDMKGGLAAMLSAARVLAEGGGLARGSLIVAAVADEEHASVGAEALVQHRRANAAIVTEPTDLDVAVAHKGFEWIEIETRGRAAHGSRPREGRDAILHMGRVLARLEALDRELQAAPAHPLLGTASLHASTIAGGSEWSSYPDRCRVHVERRTLPREPPAAAINEVEAILAALGGADAEFEGEARRIFGRPGYELAADHPLPSGLVEAAGLAGCRPRVAGMTFWSDAAILQAAGIPSVLFGPGGAGLHGPHEHVRLRDVRLCRDTLAAFGRRFCGMG